MIRVAGGASRNGLPEPRPYTYRGSDRDTTAPWPATGRPRPPRGRVVHFADPQDDPACHCAAAHLTTIPGQVTCRTCRRTTVYLEALGETICREIAEVTARG